MCALIGIFQKRKNLLTGNVRSVTLCDVVIFEDKKRAIKSHRYRLYNYV